MRNFIGYKPVGFVFPANVRNYSCSDLFFWRTDSGFKTIFRFSDIPEIYYGIKHSKVLLVFYNSIGNEIKRIKIKVTAPVTEIMIDRNYLDGLTGIGTFSIFHLVESDESMEIKITNRCYIAYQRHNSIPSFMHGNIEAQYLNLDFLAKDQIKNDVAQTIHYKNEYVVQKNLSLFDYSELLFSNPTKRKIWIKIGNIKKVLEPLSCQLVRFEGNDLVRIKSNLSMPRPVIFSYKNDFFDCHHG